LRSWKQIKLGIVGAGQMGRGMISQLTHIKGKRPTVVADVKVENAINAFLRVGLKQDEDLS